MPGIAYSAAAAPAVAGDAVDSTAYNESDPSQAKYVHLLGVNGGQPL